MSTVSTMIFVWCMCAALAGPLTGMYLYDTDGKGWDARPATAGGVIAGILGPLVVGVVALACVISFVLYVGGGIADLLRMIPRKPKLLRAEVRQ